MFCYFINSKERPYLLPQNLKKHLIFGPAC